MENVFVQQRQSKNQPRKCTKENHRPSKGENKLNLQEKLNCEEYFQVIAYEAKMKRNLRSQISMEIVATKI